MNILNYIEKKEKGLIQLIKLGDSYALSAKQYDSNTGLETAPQIVTFTREEIQNQLDGIEHQKTGIAQMLADMDTLTVQADAK